jgi:hypothetical protein
LSGYERKLHDGMELLRAADFCASRGLFGKMADDAEEHRLIVNTGDPLDSFWGGMLR